MQFRDCLTVYHSYVEQESADFFFEVYIVNTSGFAGSIVSLQVLNSAIRQSQYVNTRT